MGMDTFPLPRVHHEALYDNEVVLQQVFAGNVGIGEIGMFVVGFCWAGHRFERHPDQLNGFRPCVDAAGIGVSRRRVGPEYVAVLP